jgi:hypothetical protein
MIAPPTSSDLELLASANISNRQLVFTNRSGSLAEQDFERELRLHLKFDSFSSAQRGAHILVIVSEFVSEFVPLLPLCANKTIFLTQQKAPDALPRSSVWIEHRDLDSLLRLVVHVTIATKHRIRVCDMRYFIPDLRTNLDDNTCLFL